MIEGAGRLSPADLKAVRNRAHARRRAGERYGIDLSPADVAAVEAAIRGGGPGVRALRPDHQGRRRTLYAVEWLGRWLPVVFDDATGSLLTVVPDRALEAYRHLLGPGPGPVPVPPPAPRPAAAPFVGRVTGFVKLPPPPDPPPDPLAGLPEAPDVPEGAALGDYDSALDALSARLLAVTGRLRGPAPGGKKATGWNRALNLEVVRIAGRKQQLRQRRHRAYLAVDAARFGGDPTDPLAVLAAAYRAMGSALRRLGGGAFSEEEHAARAAVRYCLEAHARLGREGEGG